MYKCCLGLKHLGLGINVDSPRYTVGFYPATPRSPLTDGVVLPDSLRNGPNDFIDSITLKTTPAQDKAIQDFINARTADPRDYFVLGRHCGAFVQGALRQAGINPFDDVVSPLSVFRALKQMQDAGVDFSAGVQPPAAGGPSVSP